MSQFSQFSETNGMRRISLSNNRPKYGNERTLRSVSILQIYEMAKHSEEITKLYLHNEYVYLVKLFGSNLSVK